MSRTETFEATRPDGVVVVVKRDLDTGEQTVTAPDDTPEPVDPAGPSEPKGNASLADWAAWADHLEVEYPEDAKRDDIKALISSAFE